jgi:hypothetical protein
LWNQVSGVEAAKVQAVSSILDRAGHKTVGWVQSAISFSISAKVSVEDAGEELLEKLNKAFPFTVLFITKE